MTERQLNLNSDLSDAGSEVDETKVNHSDQYCSSLGRVVWADDLQLYSLGGQTLETGANNLRNMDIEV